MNSQLTVLAEETVWEAEFAGASVGVASAVAGVDLVISRCLRRLGPVVPERRPERPRDEPGEITEDTKLYVISNLNITHHILSLSNQDSPICLFILF